MMAIAISISSVQHWPHAVYLSAYFKAGVRSSRALGPPRSRATRLVGLLIACSSRQRRQATEKGSDSTVRMSARGLLEGVVSGGS